MQVSPVEIEDVLLSEPTKLIIDATVAGVRGGRTFDELVPRAWVVLSDNGKKRSAKEVTSALEAWTRKNLSKYKWLRGGVQVVQEASHNLSVFRSIAVVNTVLDSQVPDGQGTAESSSGTVQRGGNASSREVITTTHWKFSVCNYECFHCK